MQFLFGESQTDDEISAIVEDIADIADMSEDGTDLKIDKSPLSKALKSIGIDADALEKDPRGLSLVFSDGESYRAAHAILNEPDSLHKLASSGWVYSLQGDVAMANEPAEFRIRFLEIDNVVPSNLELKPTKGTAKNTALSAVIKKAREFATAKPEHDDMNPVEFDDKTSSNRRKGMGKESDGANPEGSPKIGLSKTSSSSGVNKGDLTKPSDGDNARMAESLIDEGAHKTGCQCGFCKNKGNIQQLLGKRKAKAEPVEEPAEEPKSTEESASSLVTKLLDSSNPGTQPGILGVKSYPYLGIPSKSKDRKFKPPVGMKQPTGDTGSVVNKQVRRKKM